MMNLTCFMHRTSFRHKAVIVRSDLFGGCAAIVFITLVGWLSIKLRLSLWLARTLLVVSVIGISYIVANAFVPEYNKPWGVWLVVVAMSFAPINLGWDFIADDYRSHELAKRLARDSEARAQGRMDETEKGRE